MKNRLVLALTALLIALGFTAAGALTQPADAGWPGGIVVHAADDSGYNPPIWIRCDNGRTYSLGLGVSSRNVGCQDVNAVWAGAGDTVKCQHNGDPWWWTNWNGAAWQDFGNVASVTCYQQKR